MLQTAIAEAAVRKDKPHWMRSNFPAAAAAGKLGFKL